MSEYTPTADAVREIYATYYESEFADVHGTVDERRERFDRFVAQVQADALREATEDFHEWEGVNDILRARADSLLNPNPETKEETE